MNPVLQAIRQRRSVRKFSGEPVGEEMVERLLEAGRWAPSGLNNQPWRFVIITDDKVRRQVAEKTKYRKILEKAPLHIAQFLNREQSYNRTKDLQAAGACLQNILLAAHSMNLGAVWMGEILNRREEVEGLLQVPEPFELMAILAVGHPAHRPSDSERLELSKLVFRRF